MLRSLFLNASEASADVFEAELWGVGRRSQVDQMADLAMHGTGAAKKRAIKEMEELEAKIRNDYTHVNSFAYTQEHALPPSYQ